MHNPGTFKLAAYNDVVAREKGKLESGGALAVAHTKSIIHNDSNTARITIGDAYISSVGAMELSAYTDADIETQVSTNVYGAAGVAQGTAVSSLDSDNDITISAGATLRADGDISLNVGADTDGNKGTLKTKAQADLWNRTAFPVNTGPTARATIIEANNIIIDAGARLGSARDIYLLTPGGHTTAQGLH